MLATCFALAAASGPRFSNVFRDHGVLQRGAPLSIWGFGAGGVSHLAVSLGTATVNATVNATDGTWRAVLPAQPATPLGTGLDLTLQPGGPTLRDVAVGDVLLFSGQSNIDLPQEYANQVYDPASAACDGGRTCSTINVTAQAADEAFADAHGAALRIMIVPSSVGGLHYNQTPAAELADVPECPLCAPAGIGPYRSCQCNSLRWARANASNIRGFSATAWYTGKALLLARARASSRTHSDAGSSGTVTLGLLRSSWGGTPIQNWSGPAALAKCPGGKPPARGGAPSSARGGDGDGDSSSGSTLFSSMILPFRGLHFAALYWCTSAVMRDAACSPTPPNTFPSRSPPHLHCPARQTKVSPTSGRTTRTKAPRTTRASCRPC